MSGYRRYSSVKRSVRVDGWWLNVKYAGRCHVCGVELAVGARAYYDPRYRLLTCTNIDTCAAVDGLTREEWHGSPVSGRYVTVLAETRIGSPSRRGTRRGGRRCIDAPCCGCCD